MKSRGAQETPLLSHLNSISTHKYPSSQNLLRSFEKRENLRVKGASLQVPDYFWCVLI